MKMSTIKNTFFVGCCALSSKIYAAGADDIFEGTQEKGSELVDPITNTIIVIAVLVWLGIGTAFLFSKVPAKWMASATAGSLIITAASAIVQFVFG